MTNEDTLRDMIRQVEENLTRQLWNAPAQTAETPSLNYETLRRLQEEWTPARLTLRGEVFDIYGYEIHEGGHVPEGFTVLTQKRDPQFGTPFGGVIIIDHHEGKMMGRTEDINHLMANVEPTRLRALADSISGEGEKDA